MYEENDGARRANDRMHQQRLERKLDEICNALTPTEVGLLRKDLSTARHLIDDLLAETRGLDKTLRGRKLLKRINDFLHGEQPKIPTAEGAQPSPTN